MSGVIESAALAARSSSQRPRNDVSGQAAALQGATMAFNSHTTKSTTPQKTPNPSGAMQAAMMADLAKRVTPTPHEPDPVSDIPESGFVLDKIRKFSGSSVSTNARQGVQESGGDAALRTQTPQLQAAAMAAERSSTRTPRRVSSIRATPVRRDHTRDLLTPQDTQSRDKPTSLPDRRLHPLPAPIPIRRPSIQATSLEEGLNINSYAGSSRQSISPGDKDTLHVREDIAARSSSSEKVAIKESSRAEVADRIPNGQDTRTAVKPTPLSRASTQGSKPSPPPPKPRRSPLTLDEPQPKLPPRRTTSRLNEKVPADDSVSHSYSEQNDFSGRRRTESVSTASLFPPSTSDQRTEFRRSPLSRNGNRHPDESSGISKEALADAIVASSLASSRNSSSRNSSPMKQPPPLPPHRRSRSRSLFHPLKGDRRTTPSPPKAMRQTLRDYPKSDDDEDLKRPGRRHLIRHHPHKHHEGDRRRWRQAITERERKRYEGVWAANKGLWVPPENALYRAFPDKQALLRNSVLSDLVVHLVVRDIWSRSRLPAPVLGQIWDLVDRHEIGLLSREEFVVGMWLIDQQLRGNKLPVKVPDSVWESVRHVSGIKVPLEF